MNKAILFFALQNKVNFEIETFGIATNESVAELEKLGDALTSAEIDDVCELYRKLGEFLVHDLPNYKR